MTTLYLAGTMARVWTAWLSREKNLSVDSNGKQEKMPTYRLRCIDVDFPFEAYDCQLVYMEKVIQALQEVKSQKIEDLAFDFRIVDVKFNFDLSHKSKKKKRKKKRRPPNWKRIKGLLFWSVFLTIKVVISISVKGVLCQRHRIFRTFYFLFLTNLNYYPWLFWKLQF